MNLLNRLLLGVGVALLFGFRVVLADEIDDLVAEQMREKKIPGLSLAIVVNGEIVRGGAAMGGRTRAEKFQSPRRRCSRRRRSASQ